MTLEAAKGKLIIKLCGFINRAVDFNSRDPGFTSDRFWETGHYLYQLRKVEY